MSAADANSVAVLADRLAAHRLEILGSFVPRPEDGLPDWAASVIMLGPAEPGFWAHVTSEAEWQDGRPDPIDRWSRRVIGRLACELSGKAYFPFGGPPYHPFYAWALRTGQVWDSPVRLLVHARQGLMVSFRGAIALRERITLPPAGRPCDACDAPCLTACPAGVLSPEGYDVPACRAYIGSPAGAECMTGGCLVRRACPVSRTYARMPEQSAYHMGQFHK